MQPSEPQLDRFCVERYQWLANWALQRQLKAISHVIMRTVKVATMIQEGLEINRRMKEDRDRDNQVQPAACRAQAASQRMQLEQHSPK